MPRLWSHIGPAMLALSFLSLAASPPNFPKVWSAAPASNLTAIGFDAGTVVTTWNGECVTPATQRMKTVYPVRQATLHPNQPPAICMRPSGCYSILFCLAPLLLLNHAMDLQDEYTVLTLCGERLQYIVDPGSRGGTCAVWPILDEQYRDLCGVCGCPFCIRDTGGRWSSITGSSNESVQWSAEEQGTSVINGARSPSTPQTAKQVLAGEGARLPC